MEFRFDPNQEFQVNAIEAVAGLFDGQPRCSAQVQFQEGTLSLAAIANRLDLDDSRVLANLQSVQRGNGIRPDGKLDCIEEIIAANGGQRQVRFPNFSVEMETGTGKTYVYIRTILELFKRYGMRKFIVVVPSVAVREGVLKTLRITEKHLKVLYGNPIYRYYVYDSANLTQVRQFAQTDSVEVMIMTIDSFNKASNVIRQSRDQLQGETAIHLVQAARPILILDEPQNMESEKSVAALAALDPLFALRYSATHRVPYNIVYRLTPAEAYRQGLVKKVDIDSVVTQNDENRPYIRVESIDSKKNTVTARLAVHKLMKTGAVKETLVTVGPGASLAAKAEREEYEGFEVDEINPGGQFVRFSNNVELKTGEERGADKKALFAAQIRHTIEQHFRKQQRFQDRGIKVLSLFFIDRVANYADADGIIRKLFDEAFNEVKQQYPAWAALDASAVQAAYFAQKKHKGGVVEQVDSVSGETKEDEAAYDLIMRDKESLLAFPQADDDQEARKKKQVCFIFSHSALREGWDNPNIFQVCTLRQVGSERERRQQVGRGIRLAVDQSGQRVHDEHVNVLTVVANESFNTFVDQYQDEIAFEYRAEIEARYGKAIGELTKAERRKIEAEYGEGILPPLPRKAGANTAKLRKGRVLSEEFKELWARIKHKTRYAVQIDTEKLLAEVVPAIEQADIAPPRVTITKAEMKVGDDGIFEAMQISAAKTVADLVGRYPLPNLVEVMANLMEHTAPPVRVTRRTLLELFRRLGSKKAALENPHEWATTAVRILKEKLADHLVNGIEYEKIGDDYLMQQIEDEETIELFGKYIVPADKDKALYDLIPCDSVVEQKFVEDLEARDDVRLYLKLPYWFTVPTPVGEYRPDWAIVMESPDGAGKPALYLVAETKDPPDVNKLRPEERRKVLCGAAHFGSKQFKRKGVLDGLDYQLVSEVGELKA
ncbi:MAG: DEAD/DEAH box helicase family protein [Planctomycetaceae bacterium]|nr:DEAD/DEAH box helicase family protein [Planctomycetaceae bacterium]